MQRLLQGYQQENQYNDSSSAFCSNLFRDYSRIISLCGPLKIVQGFFSEIPVENPVKISPRILTGNLSRIPLENTHGIAPWNPTGVSPYLSRLLQKSLQGLLQEFKIFFKNFFRKGVLGIYGKNVGFIPWRNSSGISEKSLVEIMGKSPEKIEGNPCRNARKSSLKFEMHLSRVF